MKVKLILGVLVVLLVVFSSLGSKNLYAQISEKFCYSEEEAKLYRMPINQVTPEDGIWTGHVIAYGHYIKPPYKIEVRDTLVFINNVQVYPALKTPGMIEKERIEKEEREARKKAVEEYIKTHQEEYEEMLRIDSMAKVIYEDVKSTEGREGAVKAVMDYYRRCRGVDSVNINSLKRGEIDVFYQKGTIQHELLRIKGYRRPRQRTVRFEPYGVCGSGPPLYETKEEREAALRKMRLPVTKEERAKFRAGIYEGGLKNGRGIAFYTHGTSGFSNHTLNKILSILSNRKMPVSEKVNVLPINPWLKRWIIYNYDPNEWPKLEKGGEE